MKKLLTLWIGLAVAWLAVVVLYAASYPSSGASFPVRVNGQTIDATWFNPLQDEIVAIEQGLLNGFAHGLKPQATTTYDLGTASLNWNNLYLAGKVFQGSTNPYTGWTVVTSTNTGAQNDFAPGLSGNTVLRMNNATLATISGFAGGYDGQQLVIESVGAGEVDLSHQDSGSTAINRVINFATSGKTPLAAGVGVARFVYDGTATRWRLVEHEQGAWITPTYAGGNFAGNGAMTWTVDAGDVTNLGYWLRGRTLTVQWYLATTSVGGTLNNALLINNGAWGSFSAASRQVLNLMLYNDAGTGAAAGYCQSSGIGATSIILVKFAGNWSAATNTTNAFGELTFEVQ